MKQTTYTLLALILLTLIAAYISTTAGVYTAAGILIVSACKFVGISCYFMEMKKAHVFWKIAILIYLFLFTVIALILI